MRNQVSAELEEGRAAALLGVPKDRNPYRANFYSAKPLSRAGEMMRNWDSGFASVPVEQEGKLLTRGQECGRV